MLSARRYLRTWSETRAEDFHPIQVGLAHAGGGAIVQVSHLLEVNAHERHGYPVGGQPVETGDGDPVLYRRASHGSVALHRPVAVDDGEVGAELRRQGIEVVLGPRRAWLPDPDSS